MAKRKKHPISLKPLVTIFLFGFTIVTLLFVAPSNIFIVLGFILLLSFFFYHIVSYFSKNKSSPILTSLFVFLFFTANVFAGFNVLTTILLLSFIIGVRLLLR